MSVLIATPCYQGNLTTALFRSLVGILDLCGREHIRCDVLLTEGEAAITRGRSNMAATFLRNDYKTFAMIDADIGILPEDFLKLLRLDKSVRGAAINLKTADHTELLNTYDLDGKRVTRATMPEIPFEISLIGGAALLIEREVIEKLSEIEELQYIDPILGPGAHIFAEQIVDDCLLSEDFAFCHLAREHGFSVWCEPSIVCSHHGPSIWCH